MEYINSFPGYEYIPCGDDKKPHNIYRGTDLGFGGYVYAEPGMYRNVALLDIQSLHPHSIVAMNCFGEYTKNFEELLHARIFIKHGDFESARTMLGGRLAPYLDDESKAKELSQALKIAINSVYGLTSASFDTPFRDVRNKNNIVALRGALFMRTLQDEVQSRGFTVAHIKTDSIKIPDATPEIIQFCMDFANQYGYTFEHEATYDRMCLVNNAVYIAKYKDGKHAGEWTATGTQFQIPYVFKKLFSKEPIEFDDLCETKSVTTALYLDRNENLSDVSIYEEVLNLRRSNRPGYEYTKKELALLDEFKDTLDIDLEDLISEGHNRIFIGKVGNFCPIKTGCNGGLLQREGVDKNGNVKYDSATGASGYRWLEAEMVKELGKEDDIDLRYFDALADAAVKEISKYGNFEEFVA